jgi:hypothetical protein
LNTFKNARIFLPIIFVALGATYCLFTVYDWARTYRIVQRGVLTKGTVVENRRYTYGRYTRQAPVVLFYAQNGEKQLFYSKQYRSQPRFQPGDQVPIWYLPAAPERATLYRSLDFVCSFAAGLFFCGIGALFYWPPVRRLLDSIGTR